MSLMLFSTAAVVLGCCAIVYLVLWLLHRIALRSYKKVPGFKPIMVIGNISRVGRMYSRQLMHHPGVYILQGINGTCHLFRKEGFFVFWMSLFPIVSVIKAELIELILNSNTSLEKSFEYSYLHQWLGRGLLTSTGSKWRTRRKLLTPSFHFRILDDFVPTFNEQSLVLVKKLRELRDADHVDIMPLVVLCTLDMVCETVMGVSIGAQTGENPKYVQAVHNLGDALLERVARPLLWPNFLFSLSRTGRGWNRDLRTLHNFTDKVIREKKASLLSKGGKVSEAEDESRLGGKKRQALMDLLLDLHVNGQQIMEQDIREEVDTFMFEGHDTTAMGITFALYCIGLYPQVQKKIQEELDAIFDGDARRPVTIDDVRNMKYLECVLKVETVMGVSIGAQTGENPKYVQAVHNLGDALLERVARPLLWPNFLFSLSRTGRGWNRDLRTLHNFTDKVIREKKASLLSKGGKVSEAEDESRLGGKKRQALMDLLLDLHVNGQQIMEQDIREEVDTFMFEGHDTTAMGITFALYCIGLYPQVQKKIQEELDAIFDGDARRPVTIDDVRNMKYLECVLKESQRLYPSVPFIGRVLNEDLKMSNAILPKGTTIHCHIQSLHRDPEWFPNPEAFDPDRFSPENVLKRHPFAYIPFSAGPRNCIGQKFALLEEKVVISNILRNFTAVSLDPRDKVLLKMEFVLRPAQPIRMKFIPR